MGMKNTPEPTSRIGHEHTGADVLERTSWTGREYMEKFMIEPVHNADHVMSGCIKKMMTVV